jgi:site-specific DNA recombinase
MRLVLAARKSTKIKDKQGHEHLSISITKQDRRGRQWAEQQGHCIVAVTEDVQSGTVAPWDRPDLKPWVTEPARMSLYDGILAYDNSRLSRGCWDDEARIRLWASEHGKRLVIVDGAQWPPRHDGDGWQWEAMAKQARATWEANRQASVDAQEELRARGRLAGGHIPFGFTSFGEYKDKIMVPTEEGRRLIPVIFAMCIAGKSLAVIAEWLSGQTGHGWHARSIAGIIRNQSYVGWRCDSNGMRIMECEPILVTPDGKPDWVTFSAAGKALRKRPARGPSKPDNRAMLALVLRCGNPECDATGAPDSPMYRLPSETSRNGVKVKVLYYRCCGRGRSRKGCGNMVPVGMVDDAVNTIIADSFDTPVMVSKLIPGHDYSAEIEGLKSEAKQLMLRDLDLDDFMAEGARIKTAIAELESRPSVPDRVELTETGESYAALWSALETPERGPWLVSQGFTVKASKTAVTVSQGTRSATVNLGQVAA